MAQRRAILHFLAVETLKDKNDRSPRIQDGFGDFNFEPSHFNCTSCDSSIHDSCSLLTEEIALSRLKPALLEPEERPIPRDRKQTIPFLQLPSEIRIKIYNYLLQPFRNPWENNRIQFLLENVSSSSPRRCHPFRNGYALSIPSTITSPTHLNSNKEHSFPHHHIHPEEYNTLLSLSLTSHQLRTELSTILFRNVSISITNLEYLFLDFLYDRPAIYPGIKKLSMTWDCHNEVSYLDRYLPDFCDFVSENLRLKELEFTIRIFERTARELVATGGKGVHWVECLRAVGMERLVVVPCITHRCSRGDLDLRELTTELEAVLCPQILEAEQSVEQVYLETRSRDDIGIKGVRGREYLSQVAELSSNLVLV